MPEPLEITGPALALVAPLDLTEACLATPAFRAIRRARPDLTPVILCPKSAVPFWAIHFQQILSYDESSSPQKLAERFSNGTYHSALILEDSRAARALCRLGVEQRIGFKTPELEKLLTDPVPITVENGPLPHRVTRYLKLAQELNCDPHHPENFAPPALPIRPQTPRIALAPDSDLGPAAEWPIPSFLELTKSLTEKSNPEFFLLSMPGKSPAAEQLTAAMGIKPPKEPKGKTRVQRLRFGTTSASSPHLLHLGRTQWYSHPFGGPSWPPHGLLDGPTRAPNPSSSWKNPRDSDRLRRVLTLPSLQVSSRPPLPHRALTRTCRGRRHKGAFR